MISFDSFSIIILKLALYLFPFKEIIFFLNILQKIEWKVPITNLFVYLSPINLAILSLISFAALFVKVIASIFSAGIFLIFNK